VSKSQAAEQPGAAVVEKRRLLRRADNPLVRAVGRLPARVHTKLLVAFLATALLVVAVGLLGLNVLRQSNDRVERLGALQNRAFIYGQLQGDALHIRLLLAENVAGGFHSVNNPDAPLPSSREVMAVDQAIASAVARIGPATTTDRLGFVPPAKDKRALRRIRVRSTQLSAVMREIVAADRNGVPVGDQLLLRNRAEQRAIEVNQLATELTNATTAKTDALIAENASAYASSRNLFIGVAAGAIALALLLGFVLSWSLIGPIQQIDFRLAAIASGDFSGHVGVTNRDELGALAVNVNRMNDELGRLYKQLESQASELAAWNRTLEARVDEQVKELRASRTRVVLAADAERRRIERDLHDGAQQHLIGLAVQLRLARDLAESDPERAVELLARLDDEIQATVEGLRDFAHGIYPPLLQDRGLADALAAVALRAPVAARVEAQGLGRYPSDVEATVYFCCLEALQNAAKHGGDGTKVTVRVRAGEGSLSFEVCDDGSGYEVENERVGAGTTNMRDRVGAIGGSLHITSSPGGGTTVSGSIPLKG
jgi:signal transduction histidine kinase